MNLTKTPYLVLFVLLASAGVGTASALITITFEGLTIFKENAQFDKDVNIDGIVTGQAITDFQNQIDNNEAQINALSGSGVSCENQRVIAAEITEYRVDSNCIIGYDFSVLLEGSSALGINTYTATVTNKGPDPYVNGAILVLDSQRNSFVAPIPAECTGSSSFLNCVVPPLLPTETFVLQYDLDHNFDQSGLLITGAEIGGETLLPLNERDTTDNFGGINQP